MFKIVNETTHFKDNDNFFAPELSRLDPTTSDTELKFNLSFGCFIWKKL